MSNTALIHETIIDGQEIAPLIASIEEVLTEAPSRDHVIVALISMALIVTYPEITPEALQTAVRDVSNYICLVMDQPTPEGADPKMTLN